MPKGFLFSCPSQHYLDYASCIARGIASERGVETTDGTVDQNVDAIYSMDPKFFWAVGHGSEIEATAECTETFLRTGDYPIGLGIMGGRVVTLLSCLCGVALVPDLVKFGAEAAIGYTEEFVLGIKAEGDPDPIPCSPPDPRADFYTFNDCDLEIQRALWDGKSVRDAVATSQRIHDTEIERYETGDRSEWYIAPYAARWLLSNKEAQVLYESGRMPTVYAGLGTLGTMFMLSGMFLVGAMVYGKATTGKWALPW